MKKLTDAVMGFVVGDTLGVPVEFMTRDQLDADPVEDMRGYGTYNQPPGTWSDDTSMMLATIDALNISKGKFNPTMIMCKFEDWLFRNCYTPFDEVFDVGNTTRKAILNFEKTVNYRTCGCGEEHDNGNGALMRILPFAFWLNQFGRRFSYNRKGIVTKLFLKVNFQLEPLKTV